MKKLMEDMNDAMMRIEKMIPIAGSIYDDWCLTDDLTEFFTKESFNLYTRLFGELPSFLKEDIENKEFELLIEWLVCQGNLGFLVKVATPVQDIKPSGARVYSWRYYATEWFYGNTFEQAVDLGLVWVAQQRDAEKNLTPKS